MKLITSILAIGCICSQPLFAQSMVEAIFSGRALVTTNQGKVRGCGLRVVGVAISEPILRYVDASLNITDTGAIAKLSGSLGQTSPRNASVSNALPIYGGWFKAKGTQAAAPTTKLLNGDNQYSKLFGTDFNIASDVLGAILTEVETQIAIRWEPGIETIYFGKVDMEQSQRNQFMNCVDEFKAGFPRK